jgi:lambda repressor-like predicted transcriptional regulator
MILSIINHGGDLKDKIAPQYLSLADLSTRSSLSVKTLRGFLSHPQHPLPHYRMQRKILVGIAEFDAWLARYRMAHPRPDFDTIVNEFLNAL